MIDRRLTAIKDRLTTELEIIVQQYPSGPAIWRADPNPPVLPVEDLRVTIESEYNSGLIANIGADIAMAVETDGMQSGPLQARVKQNLAMAHQMLVNETQNGLSQAMYAPGGSLRRGLRRVMESAA
jgi:hypothetical protein